jgi:hypothetical protein
VKTQSSRRLSVRVVRSTGEREGSGWSVGRSEEGGGRTIFGILITRAGDVRVEVKGGVAQGGDNGLQESGMRNQIILQADPLEEAERGGVGGGEARNGIQRGANHVCEEGGLEEERSRGVLCC